MKVVDSNLWCSLKTSRGVSTMQVFSRLRTLENNLFKMVPSALSCASLAGESVRHSLNGYSRLGAMKLSQDTGMRHSLHMKGRAFCTIPNSDAASPSQDNQGAPQQQQQPSVRTFEVSYKMLYVETYFSALSKCISMGLMHCC